MESKAAHSCASSQKECEIKLMEGETENNEIFPADKCSECCVIAADERFLENTVLLRFAIQFLKDRIRSLLPGMYDLINLANLANSHSAQPSERVNPGMEDITVGKKILGMKRFFLELKTDNKVQQEANTRGGSQVEPFLSVSANLFRCFLLGDQGLTKRQIAVSMQVKHPWRCCRKKRRGNHLHTQSKQVITKGLISVTLKAAI